MDENQYSFRINYLALEETDCEWIRKNKKNFKRFAKNGTMRKKKKIRVSRNPIEIKMYMNLEIYNDSKRAWRKGKIADLNWHSFRVRYGKNNYEWIERVVVDSERYRLPKRNKPVKIKKQPAAELLRTMCMKEKSFYSS